MGKWAPGATLRRVLSQAYDDGEARNITEWIDDSTGDRVVRLDLHISNTTVGRAMYGDTERLFDAIVDPIARVRHRVETRLRYESRPRPKLGAGTSGYARRKR